MSVRCFAAVANTVVTKSASLTWISLGETRTMGPTQYHKFMFNNTPTAQVLVLTVLFVNLRKSFGKVMAEEINEGLIPR
jgi:hypothetical protein